MKLTKEYLIEYFEIYAKILQIVKNNVLNDFDSGKLDNMNQKDFSTDKLLFKLNYDHLIRFKKNNPEVCNEINYTINDIKEQSISEINSVKDLVSANKNFINDKYKSLSFSPINNAYSWGKFGEFNVVICLENGYINGSVLIEEGIKFENNLRKNLKKKLLNKNSKVITDWFENTETIVLFDTVTSKFKINESELFFKIEGKQKRGEEMLQGYFIHPILVNILAEWISPSYAIIVSEVMSDHHIKNKEKEDIKRINELEQTVVKKDFKIKDLFKKLDDQMDRNEKLLDKNKKLSDKNETLIEDLNEITNKLRNAVGFIDEHKDEIRLPTTEDNTHHIYIYFVIDGFGDHFYKVYRRKAKDIEDFLNSEEKNYKTFEQKYFSPTVNAIQTWCSFREKNLNKFIFRDKSLTNFELIEDYPFEQFLIDFRILLNENIVKIRNIF